MDYFPTVCDDKQTVSVQSVTLASLSVSVPDRPVKFEVQLVTFTDWVLESGIFVTDRP